jgi:hypothetical protein
MLTGSRMHFGVSASIVKFLQLNMTNERMKNRLHLPTEREGNHGSAA